MTPRERYTVDVSEQDLATDGLRVLAQLRRETPVSYIPSAQSWLITRSADCEECQTNETLYKPAQPEWTVEPIFGKYFIQAPAVNTDMWQRYRKGNECVLGARPMNAIAENIMVPVVESQIEAIKGRDKIDLLDDFFAPINITVNKTVLGLADVPNETIIKWYEAVNDCVTNMGADPERIKAARDMREEIVAYLQPIVEEKYTTPDDTWISHMVEHAWGETLDQKREFIQGHITNMIFAGSQEGAHGCVNTIIAMSTNPEDFEQFKSAPFEWATLAGEEGLRWLPPAGSQRRTEVPATLSGVEIPAGEDLVISLISANHDEEKWGEDAHLFKMNRFKKLKGQRTMMHMTFGLLPRFCQGSTLVRAMLKTAMPRLFDAYPNIELPSNLAEKTAIGFVYNVNHLPCTLGNPA